MNIRNIENFVDGLGGVTPSKKPRRHLTRRTKYLSILGVLLIVGAVTGFGAIFTFYTQVNQTVDVDHLFQWDNEVAEDLIITNDVPSQTVGGDFWFEEHWFNYSTMADNPIEITFQFTDGNISSDGLTTNLSYWDTDHWVELMDNEMIPNSGTYTFQPGENLKLKWYFELDTKTNYTGAEGLSVQLTIT